MDGFYHNTEGIYLRDYNIDRNTNSFSATFGKHEKRNYKPKDGNIPLNVEDARKINEQKVMNQHSPNERENFANFNSTPGSIFPNLSDNTLMFIIIVGLFLYLIYTINRNSNDMRQLYFMSARIGPGLVNTIC